MSDFAKRTAFCLKPSFVSQLPYLYGHTRDFPYALTRHLASTVSTICLRLDCYLQASSYKCSPVGDCCCSSASAGSKMWMPQYLR